MYIILSKKGNFFVGDCTVNVNPTAEELAGIIGLISRGVKVFDHSPRVAVLSYSNFGSSNGEIPNKTREAVAIAKQQYPELIIEGEIQANVALDVELQREVYPFSALAKEGANTLIFPNLESYSL
jgi:malate dehydrogenase (oxaloacetate-decarboxylating)(NADP+)